MSDQAREKTVGFIGLGMMGMPMAKNILKAGFPLVACDISPAKTAEIAALGATIAANPAEPKFRKVKLSSKAMADKVLPAQGGKKLLTTLGFVAEEDAEAGPVLRLPDEALDLELVKFALTELDNAKFPA